MAGRRDIVGDKILYAIQYLSRRYNATGMETLYQRNYLELAHRTEWLPTTPLSSPTGGTASYSQLFYLLSSLAEFSIKNALELGVGRSSQLIAPYVCSHPGTASLHLDDDADWLARIITDGDGVVGQYAPLAPRTVEGREISWYKAERPTGRFDLIVVDGPQAWRKASAYNRIGFIDWIPAVLDEDFIIIVDDSSRPGERWLSRRIREKLRAAGIAHSVRRVVGGNSQFVIAGGQYRAAVYL